MLWYCVYPDYKGLFFLGWQQVRGGIGSLASAFSKVIVDLIKLEESTSLPSGLILQSIGNKMSKTHLYGSKDIYRWASKHTYSRLIKKAKRNKGIFHLNKPTPGPYGRYASGGHKSRFIKIMKKSRSTKNRKKRRAYVVFFVNSLWFVFQYGNKSHE